MKIGQSAGKSYAYILGVFLGDGCATRYNSHIAFRLNTIDEDFAIAVKTALSELTNTTVHIWKHAVKKSANPNYHLCCADDELALHLKEITQGKQIIPAVVDEWPKELRTAFIVGLMDSEGYVAANHKGRVRTNRSYFMGYKSCDGWVPHFVRILAGCGIRIGSVRQEKPRKPGYKVPTVFNIKMQSWIDSGARFNIARKQSRVDEWGSRGPYEMRSLHPRRLTSETNMPIAA